MLELSDADAGAELLREDDAADVDAVPRWLAAAFATEDRPSSEVADALGPFSCAAGTGWQQDTQTCLPCRAGEFSPAQALSPDRALAAPECLPCRNGFFSPPGSQVCIGDQRTRPK